MTITPGRWRMRNGEEVPVAMLHGDVALGVYVKPTGEMWLMMWGLDGQYGSRWGHRHDLIERIGDITVND